MTWFGDILRESFKTFWIDLRDITKQLIKDIILFPFEGLEAPFYGIVDGVHNLTVDAFGGIGQFIGDKTTERIESMLADAEKEIRAKMNELLSPLKSDIINLQERMGRLEAMYAPLKPLEQEIIKGVE
jgi:hypothetical protein